MTIIKVSKRESGFAQISNSVLSDNRMSFKAKGILVYLLSKPPSWQVQITDLVNQSTDGEYSVREGLKELRSLGYANLRKITDDKGRVVEWEYTIMEVPGSPDRGYPDVDYPDVENRDVNNKDSSNKELRARNQERDNRDVEKPTRRTDAKVKGDLFDGMLAYSNMSRDLSWMPEHLLPLAEAFIEASGITPTKADRKAWISWIDEQYDMQIKPDQVRRAVAKLLKDGMTIGGPMSVTKTARSLKAVKQEVFVEEYS